VAVVAQQFLRVLLAVRVVQVVVADTLKLVVQEHPDKEILAVLVAQQLRLLRMVVAAAAAQVL
jgi:hypothetical protein